MVDSSRTCVINNDMRNCSKISCSSAVRPQYIPFTNTGNIPAELVWGNWMILMRWSNLIALLAKYGNVPEKKVLAIRNDNILYQRGFRWVFGPICSHNIFGSQIIYTYFMRFVFRICIRNVRSTFLLSRFLRA